MNDYINLYIVFFTIGLFGFGGGYAMLPLIFQSVQDFGLMSGEEFSNLVALSQVTPGPVSVNAATYVGYNYLGISGASVATLAIATPSFFLVIIVMKFMDKYYHCKGIQAAMSGIRPAVAGLIFSAAVFISKTTLVNGNFFTKDLLYNPLDYLNVLPLIVFVGTIIMIAKFKINPIIITLIMGTLGAVICGQVA